MIHKKPIQVLLAVLLIVFVLAGCTTQVQSEPPVAGEESTSEINDTNEQYIKFQDKMSMDWDSFDTLYLEKIAQYHGGDTSDRAYTIVVTLNRMLERMNNQAEDCTILSVVLEELYDNDGISAYDFEGIVIDDETRKAMELVMIDKFDPTMGSLEYIEFYELED